MIDYIEKEEKEIIQKEYQALTRVVSEMLLIENMSDKQEDDLRYYNRKIMEARRKLKRSL